MGTGEAHRGELRFGRRRQIEIHQEERQGDVVGGNELKLKVGFLNVNRRARLIFTTTKIVAGVVLAHLDIDATGLHWVCASSKEQKL